jgi:hypothetical protein
VADGDDTPSSAPAGPVGKKKDARRQQVLIGIGLGGLVLTFLLLHRSSSAAAAATGSASSAGNGYADYGSDAYGDDGVASLYDEVQQLQSEVAGLSANTPAAATASSAGSSTTTATSGGAAVATPYTIGTTVAPGSTITSVDPTMYGEVSVASGGGLFTSPGSYVSGSAAGQQAPPGGFTATAIGNTIYEDTATGVKTYQLNPG